MDQQSTSMEPKPSPARRSSRGRQKIKIEKIENQKSLDVTFSKRRKGLFKKAAELAVLCGTPVAAVVFSRSGRAFSAGNPSVDAVLDCYLAGRQCGVVDAAVVSDDAQLRSLQQQCEELKQLRSLLEAPIDGMELSELLQMLSVLETIRAETLQKIYTLQNTA